MILLRSLAQRNCHLPEIFVTEQLHLCRSCVATWTVATTLTGPGCSGEPEFLTCFLIRILGIRRKMDSGKRGAGSLSNSLSHCMRIWVSP